MYMHPVCGVWLAVTSFLFGFQLLTCVFPVVKCVNDTCYPRPVDLKDVRSFQGQKLNSLLWELVVCV